MGLVGSVQCGRKFEEACRVLWPGIYKDIECFGSVKSVPEVNRNTHHKLQRKCLLEVLYTLNIVSKL